MPNNCFYTIVAVSKDEQALKRLLNIMNYEDNEYFIYRCLDVESEGIRQKEDLFHVTIRGDVAWGTNTWFGTVEDKDNLASCEGYAAHESAHYITLDLLCKKLGIGIELYAEESGNCFQEHYLVNHEGDILIADQEAWTEQWEDEDGNQLDEPIMQGGFDYYLCFTDVERIYG